MPFKILETPICYTTFQTRYKVAPSKLLRCSRCRCAWYISKEEQQAHWSLHKNVCKLPDYQAISKYTAAECLRRISQISGKFDHNSAAILERLYDLIRESHEDGTYDELNEPDIILHSLARVQWRGYDTGHDYLEPYYKRAWACPGMPQFLYFTDLRSAALRKFESGNGLPKQITSYMEIRGLGDGQDIAWFIIGFLVRSCVWGKLSHVESNDGMGNLRQSGYATAARKRLCQIISSNTLRHCCSMAFYPVPSFIINMGKNKHETFIEMMNSGIGPFLLEWVNYDYEQYGYESIDFLSKVDLSCVSDGAKVDILEICYNAFSDKEGCHCFLGEDGERIKTGYLEVARNVTSSSSGTLSDLLKHGFKRAIAWDMFAAKRNNDRLVLGFIYKKITDHGERSVTMNLKKYLIEWGNMVHSERVSMFNSVYSSS